MRWIVDAMNVVGSRPDGWWKDRRGAMQRLVDQLGRWAAADGQRVTVVFEKPMTPPVETSVPASVLEIAEAPRAGTGSGDDEIVRLVSASSRPGDITVVTSDRALGDRVRQLGAETYPAASFRSRIERAGQR